MKKITRKDYYALTGLLVLAGRCNEELKKIEEAARSITGDEEMGHTSDAIYNNYSADELLKKLGMGVGAEEKEEGRS